MSTGTTMRVAAALLLLTRTAGAATAYLGAGSLIRLEGKSTIHPWRSESKEFSLDMDIAPGTPQTLAAGIEAQSAGRMTVKIPVKSLKSEHGGLDKNLRKALDAEKNPDIVFVMRSYKLAKEEGAAKVVATGDLTVAGKTKEETLTGALKLENGRAVVDGEQPLLMTDFGVKPPTMMMGAVKTDDKVVIKFHLELEERK